MLEGELLQVKGLLFGFVDLAGNVDALVVEGRELVVDAGELGNKCGELRCGVL